MATNLADWNALRLEYSLGPLRDRQTKERVALLLRHEQEIDALSLKQSREMQIIFAQKIQIATEKLKARQAVEIASLVPKEANNVEAGMMRMKHLEEQRLLQHRTESKRQLVVQVQTWEKEALNLRHNQELAALQLEQKSERAAAVHAANIELAVEDVLAQHGFDFTPRS
jgi:hypothetical protein